MTSRQCLKCRERSKDISKFQFPKDNDDLRCIWLRRLDLPEQDCTGKYICEKHFDPDDLIKHKRNTSLKYNSVPMNSKSEPEFNEDDEDIKCFNDLKNNILKKLAVTMSQHKWSYLEE